MQKTEIATKTKTEMKRNWSFIGVASH